MGVQVPLPLHNPGTHDISIVGRHPSLPVPNNGNSSKINDAISTYLTLFQCNIGGDPQARLAKGSVLRKLIHSHNPSLVVLTETKRKRKDIPTLPGYGLFSLDPLETSSGGIALYYKNNLSFRISVVSKSTCNSIIWVHLSNNKSPLSDLYVCGVYAPNAGTSEDKKICFYQELNRTTSKFQNLPGYCILVGDFNARIGKISGDHATNSNMGPFLEFLEDHPPLSNINVSKTYGQYTFINVSNGNSSIIDYLLTDMPVSKIAEHRILGGDLGTSAQTTHKAIFTRIHLIAKVVRYSRPKKRPKWRAVTEKNFKRYRKSLLIELVKLNDDSLSYKSLITAVNRSKTNSLGRMRPRPPNSTNTTPEIDRLTVRLRTALENNRANPSKANLQRAIALEKELRLKRDSFETKTLLQLILRLENLHQVQKMRLFYKKVKERTHPQTNPTFVIHNPDSPHDNTIFSCTKQEYLNFWEKYLGRTFANTSDNAFNAIPKLPKLSILRFPKKTSNSPQTDMDNPLTETEVRLAIKSLKNMKAAGLDEITNEDIKLIEMLRPGLIHTVLQKIWEAEKCPIEFCQSIFHLIPKPGKPGKSKDLRLQKNYRAIALLSTIRKL